MNKYVKKLALKAPYIKRYYEEFERLYSMRSRGLKYHSCRNIENIQLEFKGNIDTEKNLLTFCSEPYIENLPRFALCETAEETIKNFIKGRAERIAQSIKVSLLERYAADEDRKLPSGCAKCPQFCLNNWEGGDGLIHQITLNMYPSPCQCKCIYCTVARDLGQRQITAESKKNYEKLFDIIDWVQKNGMISRNFMWYVACGEITIHPFKDRIFSLMKGQPAIFTTNNFIYDEKIAENLALNPQSRIKVSVDSGTPETWYKVKGVNNFDTVIENLAKYLASGTRPEQIQLKYILLPGINDNLEDYRAIIEIMTKRLKVGFMMISADNHNFFQRESIIRPAGYLLAMLRKNKISEFFTEQFFPDELEKINSLADELLNSGVV